MNTEVTIYTCDGQSFRYFYTEIGTERKDASVEEIEEKVKSCAKHALIPQKNENLERLMHQIETLETAENIKEMTALL